MFVRRSIYNALLSQYSSACERNTRLDQALAKSEALCVFKDTRTLSDDIQRLCALHTPEAVQKALTAHKKWLKERSE